MAPFIGPDRAALLKLLARAKPELPITLGHMLPQATVTHEGGLWRIVALEIDHEAAGRAGRAALAAGESWMPEHEWRFLHPTRVLVEAATKDAFVGAIGKMKWTFSR